MLEFFRKVYAKLCNFCRSAEGGVSYLLTVNYIPWGKWKIGKEIELTRSNLYTKQIFAVSEFTANRVGHKIKGSYSHIKKILPKKLLYSSVLIQIVATNSLHLWNNKFTRTIWKISSFYLKEIGLHKNTTAKQLANKTAKSSLAGLLNQETNPN